MPTNTREFILEGRFALLTSWQGACQKSPPSGKINQANYNRLGSELKSRSGIAVQNCRGHYKCENGKTVNEPSYFVTIRGDASKWRTYILELGRKFHQESVVVGAELIECSSGKTILKFDLESTIFGPEAKREESWTQLPNGMAFALVSTDSSSDEAPSPNGHHEGPTNGEETGDRARLSTDPSGEDTEGESRTQGSTERADQAQLTKLQLKITDCHVVLGRRGLGKSVLIRFLAYEVPFDLVVLDVAGDMGSLKRLATKERKVDYYMINPHDEDKVGEIILKAEEEGNKLVLLDEADRYDYYTNVKNELSDFVNLGRHYQTGYIAGARRTANLAQDFMANATYAWIFRHTSRRDLEYLKQEFPDIPEDVLRHLEDHEFIVCKNGVPLFRAKLNLTKGHFALKEESGADSDPIAALREAIGSGDD